MKTFLSDDQQQQKSIVRFKEKKQNGNLYKNKVNPF